MSKKLNYNPELEGGETRQYADTYINQELNMWGQKNGQENGNRTLQQQNQDKVNREIAEQNQAILKEINQKIKDDSVPEWVQQHHFGFYGGFFKPEKWTRYHHDDSNLPYWYNSILQDSKWDSPFWVLGCLVKSKFESSLEN